jgi:hypothetical protein
MLVSLPSFNNLILVPVSSVPRKIMFYWLRGLGCRCGLCVLESFVQYSTCSLYFDISDRTKQ